MIAIRSFFIILLAIIAGVNSSNAQQKPNILWLTYEDTSPEFIGCYGNKDAKTPNIDKLAANGTILSSAFSTAAVCSASRFCIITGVPANKVGTGNHRSKYKISEDIKGFPYYLKQAGYYTSNNSKTDYNVQEPNKFIAEAWNESSNKAGWWNRKAGQPFFAIYNSMSSHQSRTMTNPWQDYERMVLEKIPSEEHIGYNDFNMPPFYPENSNLRKEFSRVYNSIMLMDKEFGEWLNKLDKDGLKDSTIIFCFSDHGEGITRAKGSATTTGSRVPFIVWVPEMYKDLCPWGSGVVTNDVVSFEDLAPTMLALAGVEIPNYMAGSIFMGKGKHTDRKHAFSSVDRTDESSELSRSVYDSKFQYTKVFKPYQAFVRWNMYYDMSEMQQIIRNDYNNGLLDSVQASMFKARQAEYFFKLEEDNWGLNNEINNDSLSTKIDEMRAILRENIISTRDPHFIPEYVYKINKDKTPVELASNNEEYPITRILDIASLNGTGAEAIPSQMNAINNKNRYVRYWASVGLFCQNENLEKHLSKIHEIYLAENFEPAKVVLAMVLYKNDAQYISEVFKLLLSKDATLQQEALNMIITLNNEKIIPLTPKLKEAFKANNNLKNMGACNAYITMIIHKIEGGSLKEKKNL